MSTLETHQCESGCDSCSCQTTRTDKLPLITSAFLILTERCNLACKYCFVKQNAKEMTLQTAMDAVNFLIKNAEIENQTPGIVFFGGEPMLRWDDIIVPIVEYIRYEYQKPFTIDITTNLTLLTQKRIDFMIKHHFHMLASIDGDKETQNFNRPYHNGFGSFKSIEKKIKMVLELNPYTTFRATIDHRTVQYLFSNLQFAHEAGFKNMFFIPNVFAEWNSEQRFILKEQMRLFSDWFIEKAREGEIIELIPFTRKIKAIKKINYAYDKKQFRTMPKSPGQGKCGLGANRYGSIGTDGTIYGCQEMTSNDDTNPIFKIGNIYDGTDEEARFKLIKHFEVKDVHGTNCDTCLYSNICDGGCVANNYMISGDMNKMPDILCYWYQLLLSEAIYVSHILGEEKNTLFKERFFAKKQKKIKKKVEKDELN